MVDILGFTKEPQCITGRNPVVTIVFRVSIACNDSVAMTEYFVHFQNIVFVKDIIRVKYKIAIKYIIAVFYGNLFQQIIQCIAFADVFFIETFIKCIVMSMTKDKKISDQALKRAAVHGVLFRGFSNPAARQSQKPLAGGPANEAQHIDFYKEFFSEKGTAADYANLVPGSRSVKKVNKEYVVTATVTVNKETLAKYLQQMGVIRGLNSAF